jgi:hypothetical protein
VNDLEVSGDDPAPEAPAPEAAPHTAPAAATTRSTPSAAERSVLADVASTIAGAAAPVIEAVENIASGARRRIDERDGARVRRVRRQARQPLANLWQVQPEARLATFRQLEPRVVPVDRIVGTAVEGPTQRGGDFLPIRQLRGNDWQARWQRIRRAIDELVTLPPVDLIKFGDEYWVVDGHNRVAAALYVGQEGLDSNVLEARLPGIAVEPPRPGLAQYLEPDRDLRAAGSGRLSRTTARPQSLAPSALPGHSHGRDSIPPATTDGETQPPLATDSNA